MILVPLMVLGVHVTSHSSVIDASAAGVVPAVSSDPFTPLAAMQSPSPVEPQVSRAGGEVRFLSGGSDPRTAARWSWCSPIRWTIDPMNIGLSGVDEAEEIARWQSIVSSVADATGYRFDYVATGRGRAGHRPGVLPAITGFDIVITYESADDTGAFRRPTLAEPRRVAESWLSWAEDGTGSKLATGGSVIMDYRDLAETTASGQYRPADRVALMAHEFGHVMGLAHDEDESTAMFDEWIAGKGGLTPTDIASLVVLAKEPCPELRQED